MKVQNQYDDFDEFINWLKKDGLQPKTSERLWKKKIFANLKNGHKKSLANYEDFLLFKKLNSLLGKNITYKNINSSIIDVKTEFIDCVLIMKNRHSLRVKIADLDNFIKKIIQNKGK